MKPHHLAMMAMALGMKSSSPRNHENLKPKLVDKNLYEPKQFESRAKLKKRNGSKKPRSKR